MAVSMSRLMTVKQIFQRATISQKRFAENFQEGRKLDFTAGTVLGKIDFEIAGDKRKETEISDDEKRQFLHSHDIKQRRFRNLEILLIHAIQAIKGFHSGMHLYLNSHPRATFSFVAGKI